MLAEAYDDKRFTTTDIEQEIQQPSNASKPGHTHADIVRIRLA
jgi:hypothetical protein